MTQSSAKINIILGLAIVAHLIFWMGSSKTFARWGGVPPTPSTVGASVMSLSDKQFFYRFGAMNLQTLGDTGAETTAIKDYDYHALSKWFWLLHDLDPASNDVPMVAAFFFGGTHVPDDVALVVEYLRVIGANPYGNKWRWLAHAVYLARHKMQDLDLALDLAYALSKMELYDDTMPIWARQMPAMILEEKGDKDAAREIFENILRSHDVIDAGEVDYMRKYLVRELGADRKKIDQIIRMRGNVQNQAVPKKQLPVPMP